MGLDCEDVSGVEDAMEAAVGEYGRIGADLGILANCKALAADDPCQLTRWIIGYDKLPRQATESN